MKNNKKVVVVDCGANIGAASLYYKELYGEEIKKIYCFECDPINVDVLNSVFKDDRNVEISNKGVWVKNEKRKMYLERCSLDKINNKSEKAPARSASSIIPGKTNSGKSGEMWESWVQRDVELIDISNWLENMLDKNDFNVLKVDVEGAEYWILPHLLNNEKLIGMIDRWDIEITDNKRFVGEIITEKNKEDLIFLAESKLGKKFNNWTEDLSKFTKKVRNTIIEEKTGISYEDFCFNSEIKNKKETIVNLSEIKNVSFETIFNHIQSLNYFDEKTKEIILACIKKTLFESDERKEIENIKALDDFLNKGISNFFGRHDANVSELIKSLIFRSRSKSLQDFDEKYKDFKV